MKARILILICSLAVYLGKVNAQTIQTVTISLSGRSFTGADGKGIPFDEPMVLSGDATGLEKIELYYRINPKEVDYKKWYAIGLSKDRSLYQLKSQIDWIKVKLEEKGDSLYLTLLADRNEVAYRTKDPEFNLTVNTSVDDPFAKGKGVKGTGSPITVRVSHNVLIANDFRRQPSFFSSSLYFPPANEVDTNGYVRAAPWERQHDADNTFKITAGPLHPNIMYDFLFVVYAKTEISLDNLKKLNGELIEVMKPEFEFLDLNDRSGTADKMLGKKLTGIVRKYIDKRGEIVNSDNKPLVINTDSLPFSAAKNKVISSSILVLKYRDAVTAVQNNLTKTTPAFLTSNFYANVKDLIVNVDDKNIWVLPTATSTFWNGNLSGSGASVKGIGKIVGNQTQMKSVLQGTGKINDAGNYEPLSPSVNQPDGKSISILNDFFKAVGNFDFEVIGPAPDFQKQTLFRVTGFHKMAALFEQLDAAITAGNVPVINKLLSGALKPMPGLLNDPGSLIKKTLDPIVHGDLKNVSKGTTELLISTLNPSVLAYKDLKVQDAAVMIYNCFNNPEYFKSLLSGEAVIDGTGKSIERNTKKNVDVASVGVLLSFFKLIKGPSFTDTLNQELFSGSATDLDYIVFQLESYLNKLKRYNDENENYDAFQEDLAKLIADAYIKKSYLITGSSVVDMGVTSDKNPYVGLDFGLGYAPWLHSAFVHEGLNIYLRPVNKNVPLSKLHGTDKFLKMFSIFIGVTQFVSSSTVNDRYTALFNESSFKTSFLFGAGLRFNRLIRFNLAGLIYREKSLNPLITASTVKVSPSFTLSIDFNVAKLLNPIGKLFD